jgi:hypothetical protein
MPTVRFLNILDIFVAFCIIRKKFSNADLPFINNDTISQDAQKLNKLADKVALINMEPKIYKYNLYNILKLNYYFYFHIIIKISGLVNVCDYM